MSQESAPSPSFSVFQRILAYTAVTLIIVAVLSYIATLIAGMFVERQVLAEGFWPFLVGLSYIGLPVGFVFLMLLLAITFAKRGKERSDTR